MDVFWIAKGYNAVKKELASGPPRGDKPSTMAEAATWARNVLASNPNIIEVVLFEAMATVTRTAPPIVVTPLTEDPFLHKVCEDLTKDKTQREIAA